MLRLYLPTGNLLIGHRAAVLPSPTLSCLASEDEVRRLLLIALTNPTALQALRSFWAHWHSESKRVNVISDRILIDRVARMTVRGPLAAFVVYDRRRLHTVEVAQKLASRRRVQNAGRPGAPPPAHTINPNPLIAKPPSLRPANAAYTSPLASDATVPQKLDVHSLSLERRFEEMLERVPPYLPAAIRADFIKAFDRDALIMTVGVMVIWAGSHAIGVGFFIDILLLASGVIFLGVAVFGAAESLGKCVNLTLNAKDEKDLDAAARLLADVIAAIGVATFIAFITRGASRAARSTMKGKSPGLPRSEPTSRPPERFQQRPSAGEPGQIRAATASGPAASSPAKKIGYHATHPDAAAAIQKNGFRPGTKPGRLGSGGVYVNDTAEGAIAEFSHHNPGVKPVVLEVEYNPGVNASATVPPRTYVQEHPLNVESISAPSVRAPGTQNTNILNGSAKPTKVVP